MTAPDRGVRTTDGSNLALPALGDDLPPVFHLRGLVRHDGDVPDLDPRLGRPTGRAGVRDTRARGDDLAVLRRDGRRPVLRHREDHGGPPPARGRPPLYRLATVGLLRRLPAADRLH